MQSSTQYIFEANYNKLFLINPDLAAQVMKARVPDVFTVVVSKNDLPVLKVGNITFHSLYDPAGEGKRLADSFLNQNPVERDSELLVFGLGFAYHIVTLIKSTAKVTVFEPRLEVLRLAMMVIDLIPIFENCTLHTGPISNASLFFNKKVWGHQPSIKLNQSVYDRFVNNNRPATDNHQGRSAREKENLKILIVGPIYGGSLPIAEFCRQAFNNLGHNAELFDASIFNEAFQKALDLNLDAQNSKIIHDLFLHLISEMVVATCSESRPDLILALAQAPLSIKALERLRQFGMTTAFWFVEDYQLMDYWKSYASFYDFYFSIQDGIFFNQLEKTGVKNYSYLPLAADPDVHLPLTLSERELLDCGSDISFMGAGYYNREKLFCGLLDYDFKIWGNQWDIRSPLWDIVQRNGTRISTEETVRIFNASKININLHSSVCHEGINPGGDFVNPRTFEIAACKGFQLVDKRSYLGRHFTIDKEIVCFESCEELRSKIDYYLQHPDERIKIAEAARRRVISEHTYEKRMEDLLAFVRLRKPDVFLKADDHFPIISDVGLFCRQHPEAASVFSNFDDSRKSVELDQIVNAILSKTGPLQYPEAIFCLMNEFQEKFKQANQ